MNFSSNQTRYIVDEKFYQRVGSNWVTDTIYVAVISPMGFIGFMLNLLSFGILMRIKIKETKLYDYLKIYSLSSSLICLICGFLFTYAPRYFLDFTNYLAKVFKCRIFGYGVLSLYFFNNLLDILIILDRVSIFVTRFNRFRSVKPYILCPILFVSCFVINSSFIFTFEITPDEIFFTTNSINYCNQNEFGKSRIGSLLNLIVIIIRDIITLIVEIMCSILVVYHYNKFKNMSLQKFVAGLNTNLSSNVSNNKRFGNDNNTQNSVDHLRMVKRKQKHQQLLLMTIILSIFSFVTHIIVAFVFVFFVLIFFENRLIFFSIVVFGCFTMAFKHFSIIFILYFFNVNFKKQFKKLFLN
jgi:hypothetical protein